MLYFLILSK